MPQPISFRPTHYEDAGLRRLARERGVTLSDALRGLVRDRLPELSGEADLITELAQEHRALTFTLTPRPRDLPTVTIVALEPRPGRKPITDPFEQIATIEVNRAGPARVAIEIVGIGEFAGVRVLLAVVPLHVAMTLRVNLDDLSPVTAAAMEAT